jgi:hypothetical protein
MALLIFWCGADVNSSRREAARASLSTMTGSSADPETAMYLNNNTQTASIDWSVH